MTKQIITNSEILKKNLKVLIVDDDFDVRDSCKSILIMNGYDVISTSDGYDAIKQFVKYDPDLVIMDQMMPGIFGTETIQKMKKLDSTTRFILISADTTKIRLGKNDRRYIPVLSKPCRYEDLVSMVDSILLFTNSDNVKNKGISVLLDDDVYEKLLTIQSETILKTQQSCSFSQILNTVLIGNIDT